MGIPPPPPVEPVTAAIFVGVVATTLVVAAINREREAQRKRDEDRRKWEKERKKQEKARRKQEEAKKKQEEARRRQEEARRQQQQQQEARRQQQEEEEEEERRERQRYRTQKTESLEWWWETNNDVSGFSPFMRPQNDLCECGYCYSEPPRDDRIFRSIFSSFDTDDHCGCGTCSPKETQSRNYSYFSSEEDKGSERKCNCLVCLKYEEEGNFKNSNSSRNTSSSSGYASKANAAPTNFSSGNRKTTQSSSSRSTAASGTGSQPPGQNWNNNNDEQSERDTEWLNNFLKLLKAILDRCKCPLILRNKILGFFKNFAKHQKHFERLLGDITEQGIKEDDLLSIVIKLFMSDDFAKDVTYGNFISLMEFVAKFIKDEANLETAAEDEKGESQLTCEQQHSKNIQKVIKRSNILVSISALFKKIRKEIVDDNTARVLELDFSGIFTKVYHYFKHRVVRGKVMTVKEYFDWVSKLIPLVKNLRPEYIELTDPSHERREIIFEMYVTVYHGYIRMIVRVYGTQVKICTVFVREKKNRNAKDGDKYVDDKKRK